MSVFAPEGLPKSVRCQMADTTSIITLAITTAMLASAADFIKLCPLPAGYRLVDFSLSCDEDPDANATPTLAGTIGLLNADGDGLVSGTEFAALDAATAGTDVGFVVRPTGVKLPNVKNEGSSTGFIVLDLTAAAATADACTFVVKATITPL